VRRLVVTLMLAVFPCAALQGQSLRDQLSQLFIFGDGAEALFLGGSGDPNNPDAIRAHGSHFVPAAVASNSTVITFLTNAIGSGATNVPVSAASGGSTFQFQGGAPVRTSTSAGPIFAERAQTLGRGRVLAGVTRTGAQFRTFRGVDLDNLPFTFTHANTDFEGCDATAGGDCTLYGVPELENETISLNLGLDVNLTVTAFLLTYGVTDRVDIGVVLPIVTTSLRGTSNAQINPFTPPPAVHFFGGTADNPVLTASRFVEGSATGIGDVAARLKINLRSGEPLSVGVLGEARFPTGSEEDLLGSGAFAARGIAIVSARFGNFAPHANAGYVYRSGDFETDAVLGTVGFDQLLAPWATLAADLISELQVGDSPLVLPGVAVLEAPYRRTISPSLIPDRRDDLVNASLGVKLTAVQGLTVIANGQWPLNRGGLRANAIWTAGLEYNF
jgi:hypothetical protein